MDERELYHDDADVNVTRIIVSGDEYECFYNKIKNICDSNFDIKTDGVLQKFLLRFKIFKRFYLEKKYGLESIQLRYYKSYENDSKQIILLSIGNPLILIRDICEECKDSILHVDVLAVTPGIYTDDNRLLSSDKFIYMNGRVITDTTITGRGDWDDFLSGLELIMSLDKLLSQ